MQWFLLTPCDTKRKEIHSVWPEWEEELTQKNGDLPTPKRPSLKPYEEVWFKQRTRRIHS